MEAREFLINKMQWSIEQFDEVDWDCLNDAMANKADMYKVWLSKQHTGHYGTRIQVGYYSGALDGDISCPNCGMKEVASHLDVFLDEDKTQLFKEMTDDFEQ